VVDDPYWARAPWKSLLTTLLEKCGMCFNTCRQRDTICSRDESFVPGKVRLKPSGLEKKSQSDDFESSDEMIAIIATILAVVAIMLI